MKKPLTVIDLFCGAGGFSEGFRQAGFEIIWAVDNWKPAVETHKENHQSTNTICDDVIRLSLLPDIAFHSIIPDSEVIIGSPPCTFFSNSNKSGSGDKSKGKELIKAYLRIVARKKFKRNSILKYWILENVPKVQSYIKKSYSAKELGIAGNFKLISGINSGEYNAKYFGVPSNRCRYFYGDFPKPEMTLTTEKDLIPLKQVTKDLGRPKAKLHSTIIDPVYGFELKGEDVTDHHYVQRLAEFEKVKIIRLKQDKGYMGRMAIPEKPNNPSRTIMATMSFSSRECLVFRDGKDGLRAPTIREVASLMSFPIDYRFYGESLTIKYKLVGNSVPPRMSYAFGKAIAKMEGKICEEVYRPINHRHLAEFLNLNLNEVKSKVEKQKKVDARFRYHIPYFKYATYRVELTNYHSNLEKQKFEWTAEVHYNQGKEKANVFTPKINRGLLSKNEYKKIETFIDSIKNAITNHNQFQQIHCMTMEEISKAKLMGPYEFLNLLKHFLESEFDFKEVEWISIGEAPYKLPKPILIGYYVINRLTEAMRQVNQKRITNLTKLDSDRNVLKLQMAI